MKKIIIIFLLLIQFTSKAQIEVGNSGSLDGDEYEIFLKTTTIFVFSNVHEKSFYEEMLKKNWTITPYKIIDYTQFNILDYVSNKYSFCILSAHKPMAGNEYLNSRLRLYVLDLEKINKKNAKTKWEKYSDDEAEHRRMSIVLDNRITFGKVYFYPYASLIGVPPFSSLEYGKVADLGYKKMEMGYSTYLLPNAPYLFYMGYTRKDVEGPLKDMHYKFYNEKIHYNYEKVTLSNYIKEFNEMLTNKEVSNIYLDEKRPSPPSAEIKNLKKEILYIPEYLKISYNGWKANDTEMAGATVRDMLSTYKYKYEWVSINDLNEKMENGEEFYYLNYTRNSSFRQFQFVNGQTGEIIYKFINRIKTMNDFDPKAKDFEKISKEISEF